MLRTDLKNLIMWAALNLCLVAKTGIAQDYYVPSPPGNNPIPSHFVATTETVQHVPLPKSIGKVLVDVDGIGATITLLTGKPELMIRSLNQYTSGASICVDIQSKRNHIRLKCRSRKLDAKIIMNNGRRLLEIREIRGIPWSGQHDPPPYPFYPKTFVNAKEEPCPGVSPIVQAECLLFEDKLQAAVELYRQAYDTLYVGWAAFRLGDMAYRHGEGAKAAGWYLRVPQNSPFSRIAKVRLCEMIGDCFFERQKRLKVFATLGVPEPMRTEIELRHWRVMAYLGEAADGAIDLSRRVVDEKRPKTCLSSAALCRRIFMAGFDKATDGQKIELLRGYISLPDINNGPLAWPAAQKAAMTATAIGAPSFAAKILAAVTQEVPDEELEEHLIDIAHLFILGGDTARADVILEYAKDFFGSDIYYDERWRPIIDGINSYEAPSFDIPPMVEKKIKSQNAILRDSADFADAVSTMARAKSFGTEFKTHWKDSYPLAYETIKELEDEEKASETDAGVPEEKEESWWQRWMPEF